jgi:hypothetical protein
MEITLLEKSLKWTLAVDSSGSTSGEFLGCHITRLCHLSYTLSKSMLMHMKQILYFVFQVHQVVQSESVAAKSTLHIQKKVPTLQDSDEAMIYHVLHDLTHATNKADRPVTTCKGAVFAKFQKWDNHRFSPGSWHQALCLYTTVTWTAETSCLLVEGERAQGYGCHRGQGMCCWSALTLQEASPYWNQCYKLWWPETRNLQAMLLHCS